MSNLKYELKCLISRLSADANKIRDREIKQKYYFLKEVAFSKQNISFVCFKWGKSRDYFYKWAKRLLEAKDLNALKEKSKAPSYRPSATSPRIIKKIKKIRKKEPYLGGERISFELRSKHKMKCPSSTVSDILKRENMIDKTYTKRATKKHLKRYRRPFPGYVQLDIKYVPYKIHGQQYYEFNAVDHHSSYRVMDLYKDRSIKSVIDFLDKIHYEMPFKIIQIQTDNAVEFTDKFSSSYGKEPSGKHAFDTWCMMRLIEHKLIPVGEKELNGKVENTHRFDDIEFYSQIDPASYEELKNQLAKHMSRWNTERATKTLGWLTPEQTVKKAYIKALAMLNYLIKKYPSDAKTIKYTYIGTARIENLKKKKKAKRKSYTDRYLQYLDWLDKKAS